MPILLTAPARQNRGPDGQGWNRECINSMGAFVEDECALRPRDYTHLIEAQDTRRARWGGYGACVSSGKCDTCPVFNAPSRTLRALDNRVLVRIGQGGQPYLMNRPEDGWASLAQRWTWQDLARIDGWAFGPRYRDEYSDGFWLERATAS